MAKRDKVDENIYGMEGVPADVIEDRLRRKVKKKMIQLEKELKKLYKIDLDDPKFRLEDYQMPDPRPKKSTRDIFRTQMPIIPMKFMPPPLMYPPVSMMPPMMLPMPGFGVPVWAQHHPGQAPHHD